MRLSRSWIEAHIPHAGKMCLLDEVLEWNSHQIICRGSTHRAADNPLRAFGRLGAACGIEYAAQTMAIHGALVASGEDPVGAAVGDLWTVRTGVGPHDPAPIGYIASVRGVSLFVDRLDDVQPDLIATAERVSGDARTVLYEFSLSGGPRVLLSGRATIVFDIGA